MRKLIYHVATTLDGFIAHKDGSADGFLPEGDHVDDYMKSLQEYDTVIMGRRTYEFGYDFGLKPGQPAYPHMEHYIFSSSLHFEKTAPNVHVVKDNGLAVVKKLKKGEGTDIYLCGGGNFAGFLLKNGLIDELKIKLNPILFGNGIHLFGDYNRNLSFPLIESKTYDSGVLLLSYAVNHS